MCGSCDTHDNLIDFNGVIFWRIIFVIRLSESWVTISSVVYCNSVLGLLGYYVDMMPIWGKCCAGIVARRWFYMYEEMVLCGSSF
jgi:hypothetical protein